MPRSRATLADIAARAGCSITITSQVLNRARSTSTVGAALRARVLAVAEELGYRPNYHARALFTGRSAAIGFPLEPAGGEGGRAWLMRMMWAAESRIRECQLDSVVIGSRPGLTVLSCGLTSVREGRVDGLVMDGGKAALRDAGPLIDIPAVLMWQDVYDTGLPTVGSDEIPGTNAAIDHLLGLGHRRLLWLSIADNAGAQRRRDHVIARATAAGAHVLEHLLQPSGDQTIAGIIAHWRDGLSAALPTLPPFTAVIGYNDLVAVAAEQALWAAGRNVPRDVSVLGFDDLHASYGFPALTSVDLGLAQIGRRAVDLLLEILAGATPARGHREALPSHLVVRDSTARLSLLEG